MLFLEWEVSQENSCFSINKPQVFGVGRQNKTGGLVNNAVG
jgi:hypothetical protein